MRVDTVDYELSYGREPRGVGFWFFRIGDERYDSYGSFRRVLDDAKRLAVARGLDVVEVLP